MATSSKLPSRLHHTAYVTRDLEETRKFYEELIGLPLVATWCESDELFGAERVYCHLFFALGDGGALAFFKFAKPEDQELFGPKMPATPFHHIALNVDEETQQTIEKRLAAAGIQGAADVRSRTWLLPLGLRDRSQWTDPGIHAR